MKMQTKELKAKLDILKPALAKSGSIPELKHFMFDGDFAYAFDGGIGIRVPFATEFTGCVSGAALLGLLQKAPSEVEVSREKEALIFKLGRSRIKLATLEAKRFPWKYPDEWKAISVALTKDFIAALKLVSVVKVAKPGRIEHNGVTLFSSGKSALLYTTNSKTVLEASAAIKLGNKLDRSILAHSFVEQIIALGKEGDVLNFGEEYIVLEAANDVLVYSSMFDSGTVQDLPELISTLAPAELVMTKLPPDFLGQLDQAVLLAVGTEEPFVTLTTKGKELILSGAYNLGEIEVSFPLEKGVPAASIKAELPQLQLALPNVSYFSITERALILENESRTFLSAIASYIERRKMAKRDRIVEE